MITTTSTLYYMLMDNLFAKNAIVIKNYLLPKVNEEYVNLLDNIVKKAASVEIRKFGI